MNRVVPQPPVPFTADTEILERDSKLYRVHSNRFTVTQFNPGHGAPTRFAFFGTPPVPVLYAAATEAAALAESLLHDVPVTGGLLVHRLYMDKVMGRIDVTRDLRLARLRGLRLRKLGVRAADVTDTDAGQYPYTVEWAAAAHAAGFDGVAWTSHRCNDSRAVALFGDRCADAVRQDTGFARIFSTTDGLDWLTTTCLPLNVQVLAPPL